MRELAEDFGISGVASQALSPHEHSRPRSGLLDIRTDRQI
jgi:hypothetical protein